MRKCLSIILAICFLLVSQLGFAQIFSNTTVALCNSWNSNADWNTALTRTIAVSGLPSTGLSTSGTVLREVRVRLGSPTCKGDLRTYVMRLKNPQGVTVEIARGIVTSSTSMWVDVKFRDDISLERINEYPITVQQSYFPFSIGYYAIPKDSSFNDFNTTADPNGDWTFEMIENTSSEVSFERVDLVFGSDLKVTDVTSCTNNNNCSGASCIFNGVFRGNNSGYSPVDPQYPGNTVDGCSWNGDDGNSAWFSFTPTAATCRITLSGLKSPTSNSGTDIQPIVLEANGDCQTPNKVPTGGCPKDIAINNFAYLASNGGGISSASNVYLQGITANCEFNLSGLTVGQKYYLYVDGFNFTSSGNAEAFFYIEVEDGVSTPCSFCCTPITLAGPSNICAGASAVTYTQTGGAGTGTWSVTPASAGSINTSGQFTPSASVTADVAAVIKYAEGLCEITKDVVVNKCGSFGIFATAPWLTTCTKNSFFNTTGEGEDLIDRFEKKNYNDTFLGTYLRNTGSLKLRGAEVKTFKGGSSNVCGAKIFYRIVPEGGAAGTFNSIDLLFFEDCNTGISEFPSGGPCKAGDQKWQKVRTDAEVPVDLTAFAPGKYTLQVYYEVTGDNNSSTACNDLITLDNAGRYYNASFTIQDVPQLTSTNPTTCSKDAGTITIGGLAKSTVYAVTYSDDGTVVGPADLSSDSTGNIIVTGLNAGTYNTFSLSVNGCTIPVTGTQTLTETPLTLQSTKKDNTVCNGSGGTGCTATGTTVVLNEVRHFPPGPQGIVSTGTEYVELYNPTCSPIDISCYMIGTRANSISGGTIILPQGTILEPKAHFVIGTSSSSANTVSVDFKTNQNTSNYCVTGPNFLLANGDGWISLYDKSGTVVDAIYWTISDNQPGKIDNDDDLDDNPCTPSSVNGCATSGISLLSAKQINVQFPDRIVYVGRATSQTGNPLVSNGKAFSRIPDGGSWQRDIDPSIDGSNCNNSQCDTPPSGGTCDGSVSVTVSSGSGDYSYQWKDSLNTVIATTASVSNLCAGKYCVIVTDNVSGCIDSTCVTIVDDIKQQTNPTFNLPASICEGTTAPVLNTTSDNGIKGSWSPDTVDNQNTTSYTFTPDAGQCAKDTTITINVNKKVEPTFTPVAGFCQGAVLTQVLLPETSTNGITGTWNPPGLSSDVAGDIKYIFTPGAQFCADTTSITVTVTPKPSLDPIANVVVTDGDVVSAINFNSNPSGATYSWTNSQSGIGLAASGTGNLPSFTAINLSDADVVATITVTPSLNTCGGTARTFTITVKPRTKDIFVPNVFSPNGDGKNDQLKVYGNYITKLQMVIFNQWGEQIIQLNNVNQGWDGTHKGKPQPVGVYVYVLKATLSTGKEVTKKGSITLVR